MGRTHKNELHDTVEIMNAFRDVLSNEKKLAESMVKFNKIVALKGYKCVEKAIEKSNGIDVSLIVGIRKLAELYGKKLPNIIEQTIMHGLIYNENPNNTLDYLLSVLRENIETIFDSAKINPMLIYEIMAIFYSTLETGHVDPSLYEPLLVSSCLVCGKDDGNKHIVIADANKLINSTLNGIDTVGKAYPLEYRYMPIVLCDTCYATKVINGKLAIRKIVENSNRGGVFIKRMFDYLSGILHRYYAYYYMFRGKYESFIDGKTLLEAIDPEIILLVEDED